MVQLPPINNPAAAILAQVLQASESRALTSQKTDQREQILNHKSIPELTTQATTAQSKLSQQLFSLNHQTVAKLKMQLFDNVGKALGVNLDEYAHFEDFAKAVEDAYKIVLRDAGILAIKAIERETGLTDMGLTLKDVIDSMKDPEDNDKVTKALVQKYNLDEPEEGNASSRASLHWL